MTGPLRDSERRNSAPSGEAPSPSSLRSSTSPRAAGRGEKAISFSRRAFAPELCHAIPKQALPSTSPKKGGGAPIGAPNWAASNRCGARPFSCLPHLRGRSGRGALAFRRPTAAFAEVLPSARPGPALPGTTGCKRENPLRHQCSEHLAVRTRAGRADAQAAHGPGYEARPREPLSLRQSAVTG